MSVHSLYSLLTLAFGFAFAGMLASLYQLVTERPASFTLLSGRAEPQAIFAVPFLMLTAPFIIMRNTVRGVEIESRKFGFAMAATIIAGSWSLASGTLMVKAFVLMGLIA